MHVRLVDDPREFLDVVGSLLLRDEPRHNLILGLAATVRDHPGVYPEHRLWIVETGGEPVGAALRTPPRGLVLAQPHASGALEASRPRSPTTSAKWSARFRKP